MSMSKISKSRLWFTVPKHWQRTLLEGQAPIIFSMGARKRNSSKGTEETLKWNKGKYVQQEGSVWCWNELLREDMKPYLVWSLHYWPGNLGDTWNIQHWLSSVTQTTRPAFSLTRDRTPSPCQQGHLRSLLIDATWLLSCRQHAAGTASCSHLWCQGCQDRDHSTDPVPSQAVNLCCLCAEQDGQSLHKELFFSHHAVSFPPAKYKMYLFFLEAWADYLLLWVPCPHFVNRLRAFGTGRHHSEKTAPSIRS